MILLLYFKQLKTSLSHWIITIQAIRVCSKKCSLERKAIHNLQLFKDDNPSSWLFTFLQAKMAVLEGEGWISLA